MRVRRKEDGKKDEALELVRKDIEDAAEWHDDFVTRCDRWYRSYRAILEEDSPAAEWTFKEHPPYAMYIADTVIANLRDERLRFKGKPRPRMEADMQYLATLRDASQAQEYMISAQLDRCRIDEKTRPFYTQSFICGLTGYKTYWRRETRNVKRRVQEIVPVYNELGQVVSNQAVSNVRTQRADTYDDPYAEVIDVRDLWWRPRGARSIDRVNSICHRVWMTVDEIRALEAGGVYRKGAADKLSETKDYSKLVADREKDLFKMSRTKDMVEVIERWTRGRVITIANREVTLADTGGDDEGFPFWHGDLPFVLCATNPDMFLIPGVSEVEKIMGLQEVLWSLMNQRLDNTELLNNAVLFYRDGTNPDEIEIAPGAQNAVAGNPAEAVYLWSPNPISAQISIPAEASIRADIRDLSGAAPLLSGSDSSVTADQQTATGVSIVTTIAQKILASKKNMGSLAHKRLLEQFAWLDRQFLTQPRVVERVGEKGATAYFTVRPEHFDPEVAFEMEPAEESILRDQRRAESQALLQVALSAAVPSAMAGEPLNIPEFVRNHLRSYGIDDPDRFFLSPEQAQKIAQAMGQAPQPGPGQNGGGPPNPLEALLGGGAQTSPLASGPASPSNEISLSGEQFPARMLSQTGREQ